MRRTLCCVAFAMLLPALAQADIANRTRLGKNDMSFRNMIAQKLGTLPAATTGRPDKAYFTGKRVTGWKSLHAMPDNSTASIEFTARPVRTVSIFGKQLTIPTLGGCKGLCVITTGFTGIPQLTSFEVTSKLKVPGSASTSSP